MAYDDRPFGADQFYGDFNSWEDTKTWFASVRQAIGADTEASFAFRRHSDLYVLYRDHPDFFTNHHAVESYVGTLRRSGTLSQNVSVHYGAEFYRDTIVSNNLGNHQRDYGAVYASIDMRALRRFSFSAGIRENAYGSLSVESSPSVSGGVWLHSSLKLRASVSHAFRLPTYTDLYYHDPANLGSPNLRPERAWSYETGLQLGALHPSARRSGRVSSARARRHRLRAPLHYRYLACLQYRPAALHRSRSFAGRETLGGETVAVRYTAIHGAEAAFVDLTSKYVFNYPSQSAVAEWRGTFSHGLLARTRIGALNRRGRDPVCPVGSLCRVG